MSTITLQERFQVDAPAGVVWGYLTDPERTVTCLPGAELLGQEDERTYEGALKVKVGAVTIAYRGRVVFEEIDDEAHRMRLVGKGREKAGSGSATMTMESRVVPLEGGRSEVTVNSEVRLTGRIVRFGRGMIDTVSAEIFREFRERLAASIRGDLAAEAPPDAEGGGASVGAGASPPAPERAPPDGEALSLLPLLWRALRSWLGRFFGGAG